MPFIKYKPFTLDSRPCYKCGKEITQGSFNWTYHTRTAGMFAHRQCDMSELEFQRYNERFNTLERPSVAEVKPEPTQEIIEVPSKAYADITDLIELEGKHKQTSLIKTLLKLREYPFLYGSPGAGKTHLVISLAEDMGLESVTIPCSSDMFKSEMLGSVSPINGNYFATAFRKAWENGGVIMLDEAGLASGAFLNVMNAALAQKEIRFPDGRRVKMHPHCFILFADNSALYGNDPLFPERQDAGTAFRDRIAYVKFEYDEKLESRIVLAIYRNDTTKAANWINAARKLRSNLPKDVPVFASPRFVYAASKAFQAGLTYDQVIDIYLMRGLNGDIAQQCKYAIDASRGSY